MVAIGCADPPALVNAWSARVGDTLTVRCNFSRDMFQLRCDDSGRWIGDRINCSNSGKWISTMHTAAFLYAVRKHQFLEFLVEFV